ncbi:hypothetical protein BDV96DRAFT_653836 [Lophiotrema nucula]|uniref:SWIM-type domain-containing protein n=1 Tax=Lophiotrema nucula TaxID=690887 RepID=A0A6A5YJ09_9PLEO|nr:hypothetical protein BDV96DRAFT_653836 [Lophiotrema nucula]
MPLDKLVEYSSDDEMLDMNPSSPTILASVGDGPTPGLSIASLNGSASSSDISTPERFPRPQPSFNGTPTPLQMHDYIVWKRSRGQYYTVTTLGAPWEQWAPPLKHADMETRPCHCSNSRIHKLTCGHIVSLAMKAEECAANCTGMEQGLTQDQVSRMQKIASYSESVTNLVIKSLLQQGRPGKIAIAKQMGEGFQSFKYQQEHRDLIGGDFACKQCAYTGQRPTYPTFYFAPMHVIIVIRDAKDQAIVDQIKRGVRPESQNLYDRRMRRLQQRCGARGRGGFSSRGRGGRGGVMFGRVRRDVAIDKARRDEKTRVIQKMNDDAILDDMYTLGADW